MLNRALESISKLTPQERREELTALLLSFPPAWVDEAVEIAQEFQRNRARLSAIVPERVSL